MKIYNHARYESLLNSTFATVRELGKKKGGEYAGDEDRLLNFRRNGERQKLPMETVWAVYAAKHFDAIQQAIIDFRDGKERERMESLAGRCDDLIVYLVLFKAMIEERDEQKSDEWKQSSFADPVINQRIEQIRSLRAKRIRRKVK